MASKNRVLRRTFGPERDEVTGGWRRLHNEELPKLHASPDIIEMNKSMWVRGAGHVAHMGEARKAYNISAGNPEGKRPLEEVGVDVSVIVEWILQKQGGNGWTGYM
jgi:hypothetical protein